MAVTACAANVDTAKVPGPGSPGGVGTGSATGATGTGSSGNASSSGGAASVSASGGATGTGGGAVGSGSGGASSTGGGNGLGASGGRSAAGGASSLGTGGFSAGVGGAATGAGGAGGAASLGGQCPANAIFCADFESTTIPAQALFFPEYLRPTMSTYLTIDTTTGFNSSRSAKFMGTSFSQMLGVLTGVPSFWVRLYLRSDADMSMIPGHATYVAATDGNGDPNMGEHVRIGEHECQLELNRKSDDKELLSNGGTYQCSGGIVLAKNAWTCLEAFFNGPSREVRVFVAGAETVPLHVTDWGPYPFAMFKFGFENYSSPARNMWYDDVAVAAQRIGCH